eukprot:2280395-Prymnesium_polylepis.1
MLHSTSVTKRSVPRTSIIRCILRKKTEYFFKLGRIPLALLFPAQYMYSCDTPPSPAITLPR